MASNGDYWPKGLRDFFKRRSRLNGLKMWRMEGAALTKRHAWGCKRLYQKLTYSFLLGFPIYNDGQRGVFKYTIILQSSTDLLNTLTLFPQVLTQCPLPRFPLFSTPLGESSTPLLAPITVCPVMGNPPIFLAPSTPQSCAYWNPESAGDLQEMVGRYAKGHSLQLEEALHYLYLLRRQEQ